MPERADPAQAAGRRGLTIPDKQVPGVYHRRIGDIVVTALSDGYVDASYTVMRIAPEDAEAILARHFRPSPPRIAVNAFAVHSGGRLALVETGSGSSMGPTLGWLSQNLSLANRSGTGRHHPVDAYAPGSFERAGRRRGRDPLSRRGAARARG
jgi:hypothetical protein